MAIFEKSLQTKAIVDDTEDLICTIENAQNINKHTEYILRVQRGPSKENRWNVSRRYRDFTNLHASLQQAGIDLPLPRKKLLGNMQPSFIAERQLALQNYINEVLKHPYLAMSLPVRSFLDPNNYSLSLAEQALQSVSIALRGDGRYELRGPLPGIGWRPRKHYFLVKDVEKQTNCLLSWQSYGPDRALDDKDMQTAFRSLQNHSHPYIDQILAIHNLETGAYVVRKIHENGSMRDMLYGTEYSKNFLAKYANPKVRYPFSVNEIAHYGYQILQAIKFLHDKGITHGNIHPGNIAIENQTALLMDVESSLIGASGLHRPHALRARRAPAAASADVIAFGLTLHEMAGAEPPAAPGGAIEYTETCYEDLDEVLSLCLCGKRPASLPELLAARLWARAGAGAAARGQLKFPLTLKDALAAAIARTDERYRNDHKMVRTARREVRIQEILNSEVELKKQKKRARQRDTMWKSMSSLADTVPSHSASTASSPTPPVQTVEAAETRNGGSLPPASPAAAPARSALLDAICGFDKSRLSRVAAR